MSADETPERFRWNGILFLKREHGRDQVVRYESHPGDMVRGHLVQEKTLQWSASFEGFTFSTANTREGALYEALQKAIGMLSYKADRLEHILRHGRVPS